MLRTVILLFVFLVALITFDSANSQAFGQSNNTNILVSVDSLSESLFSGKSRTIEVTLTNSGPDTADLLFLTDLSSGFGGYNHCLWFDGEDDIVEVLDDEALKITDAITLEAWMNFEVGGSMQPRVLSNGPDGEGYEIVTDNTDSLRTIQLRIGPGELESKTVFRAGQWYHIAYTYDGSIINLYVDGKLDCSTPASGPLNTSSTNLYFGQKSTSAWDKYKGYIDEVRIWSVARSAEDIQRTMHREILDHATGLVGYWPFNEMSGDKAFDRTSNGNHGTLLDGVKRSRSDAPIMSWILVDPPEAELIPGSSAVIEVTLSSLGLPGGEYSGTIIMTGSTSSDSLDIPVNLNVINAPSVIINKDLIDFNKSFVNERIEREFTISNSGNQDLIITSIQVGYPDFKVIESFPTTIEPWGSKTITLVFNPETPNRFSVNLTIRSNDPLDDKNTVKLLGVGLKPPVITVPGPILKTELLSGKKSRLPVKIRNDSQIELDLKASPGRIDDQGTMYFDGMDDCVHVVGPSNQNLTNPFTIEAWIYPIGGGRDEIQTVLYQDWNLGLCYNRSNNRISFRMDEITVESPYNLKLREWTHIAFRMQDSNFDFYINGQLDTTGVLNFSDSYNPSFDNLFIGGVRRCWHGCWTDDLFNGYIEDVRIWKNKRTLTEIQTHMHHILVGEQPDLQAYWQFNGKADTLVMDLSGNKYHGEIFGNPDWHAFSSPVFKWFQFKPHTFHLEHGSSAEHFCEFNALYTPGGTYNGELVFAFPGVNDLTMTRSVQMHVTDAPSIHLKTTEIFFNEVFINDTITRELRIENTGSEDLNINIYLNDAYHFSTDLSKISIPSGKTKTIHTRFFPSEEASYNDQVMIASNDPIYDSLSIPISGKGVYPPQILIAPDSIIVGLNSGDSSTSTLIISNLGFSDLYFDIIPDISNYNYALSFDEEDFVVLGDFGGYSDEITIEAWIRTFGSADWADIIAGPCDDIILTIQENSLNFAGQCGSPIDHDTWSKTQLNDSIWHHVAGTYDGNVVKVYVDGEVEDSSIASGSFVPGEKYIGCSGGEAEYFTGIIDELRLWNSCRSQEDIQALMYRELTGKESGLFSYWTFNEGSGGFTYDKTDNSSGELSPDIEWISSDVPLYRYVYVSPDTGICPPDSSVKVSLKFSADNLEEDIYCQNILISSNDPLKKSIIIPVCLEIWPVSSNEKPAPPSIHVYPNPASDRIYLEITDELQKGMELEIICMTGNILYHQFEYANPVDLTHIPPGLYFIKVIMNGNTYIEKLVMQ